MVEAARPSCRAIARKLSPSPLSAASRSLSSSLRCVPPDIAPSRIAIHGQSLTTRPRDVALHAGLRPLMRRLSPGPRWRSAPRPVEEEPLSANPQRHAPCSRPPCRKDATALGFGHGSAPMADDPNLRTAEEAERLADDVLRRM